jgi:hypothetical protein
MNMATPRTLGVVRGLEDVTLDGITALADLQTRTDRKYLVPTNRLDPVLRDRLDRALVLSIDGMRTFRYESVYFDTPDLVSYHDAARRRPRRFKVRTRSYHDTGHCVVEVKCRDARNRTVKHRQTYDIRHRDLLTADARQFIAGIEATSSHVDLLTPALTTVYLRTTLLLPDDAARVTIDTDLRFLARRSQSAACVPQPGSAQFLDRRFHGPLREERSVSEARVSKVNDSGEGCSLALGPYAMIETKTLGRPCVVDRILWRSGHRPVTFSKYGTGLAALDPGLRANKWNRVLRRTFGWEPTRESTPA